MKRDATSLSFECETLHVGGQAWHLPHSIADARMVDDIVVVIYDHINGSSHGAVFQNVDAFGLSGQKLWTAQHPTNGPADVYLEFSLHPLELWNIACYRCTIDPGTGRLLEAVFTK